MFLPLMLPAIDASGLRVVRTVSAEISVSAALQLSARKDHADPDGYATCVLCCTSVDATRIGPSRSTQTGYVITYET